MWSYDRLCEARLSGPGDIPCSEFIITEMNYKCLMRSRNVLELVSPATLIRSLKYVEDRVDIARQTRGKTNVPTSPCETTKGPSGHIEQPGKSKNPQFNAMCD